MMRSRPNPRGPLDANLLLMILLGVSLALLIIVQVRKAVYAPAGAGGSAEIIRQPLYFETGGFVAGFSARQISLTTEDEVLLIEFAGANGAAPEVLRSLYRPTLPAQKDRAYEPLDEVRYGNLWPGITLVCSRGPGGALRSSFTLAAGANPDRIRLRYSSPVAVEPDGRLAVYMSSGTLIRQAPLAWQTSAGEKVYTAVSYVVEQTPSGQEVRLKLGDYDPRYPLIIWQTLTAAAR